MIKSFCIFCIAEGSFVFQAREEPKILVNPITIEDARKKSLEEVLNAIDISMDKIIFTKIDKKAIMEWASKTPVFVSDVSTGMKVQLDRSIRSNIIPIKAGEWFPVSGSIDIFFVNASFMSEYNDNGLLITYNKLSILYLSSLIKTKDTTYIDVIVIPINALEKALTVMEKHKEYAPFLNIETRFIVFLSSEKRSALLQSIINTNIGGGSIIVLSPKEKVCFVSHLGKIYVIRRTCNKS